jgi:hypothetical protein
VSAQGIAGTIPQFLLYWVLSDALRLWGRGVGPGIAYGPESAAPSAKEEGLGRLNWPIPATTPSALPSWKGRGLRMLCVGNQ